jgi:hypothetical protein
VRRESYGAGHGGASAPSWVRAAWYETPRDWMLLIMLVVENDGSSFKWQICEKDKSLREMPGWRGRSPRQRARLQGNI